MYKLRPWISHKIHFLLLCFFFFILENLIRGLDDDEINFLEIVDKAKLNAERQQQIQEHNEMNEFRQRVTSLQEQTIDKVSVLISGI